MTFPRNSAWSNIGPDLTKGLVNLPGDPIGQQVLGATKKLGVVEIPVEQLENWYAMLDDLHAKSDSVFRHGHAESRESLLELRDAVYSFLRG